MSGISSKIQDAHQAIPSMTQMLPACAAFQMQSGPGLPAPQWPMTTPQFAGTQMAAYSHSFPCGQPVPIWPGATLQAKAATH
eukprot:6464850-Amphidinium_carterae.1